MPIRLAQQRATTLLLLRHVDPLPYHDALFLAATVIVLNEAQLPAAKVNAHQS